VYIIYFSEIHSVHYTSIKNFNCYLRKTRAFCLNTHIRFYTLYLGKSKSIYRFYNNGVKQLHRVFNKLSI